MQKFNPLAVITIFFILTACGGNKIDGEYFVNEEDYEAGNYLIISGDKFLAIDNHKVVVDNCVIVNPKQAYTKAVCDEGDVFEIELVEGGVLLTFEGDTMAFKKNN